MSVRLLLTVLTASACFAQDAVEQAVKDAASGWTTGAIRQDEKALDRFLADDLQYAHAGGQIQNKEQYIMAVTTGPARYESFGFSDVKVVRYGKAAVLTAFVDVKLTGRPVFRVRTLQVYVEKSGHWQMAAHQSTRLSQ